MDAKETCYGKGLLERLEALRKTARGLVIETIVAPIHTIGEAAYCVSNVGRDRLPIWWLNLTERDWEHKFKVYGATLEEALEKAFAQIDAFDSVEAEAVKETSKCEVP